MALQVWLPLNGDLKNQGLANVTVTNSGATVNNAGKIGKCYSFDGNTNYIALASTQLFNCFKGSSNPFSITFWFYNGESSGARGVLFGDHGTTGGVSINIELNGNAYNNSIRFYWGGNPDWAASNSIISPNTWAHVAITYSGSAIYVYINGVLKDTRSGVLNTISKTSGEFRLGRDYRTGDTALKGKINDFRIYDHCLSPKEVKEISKGLVLHYKLDDPYVEATTNIASSLTPQANKGGWGKLTATQLGLNSYHFKHKTTDSSNLSYWSTFVYTLPSEYTNKTISFSARLKNIKYDKLASNGSTSWLFIGQGNDGQYPTHGSVTKYFTQLEENMVVSWTGTLSNSYRYLVIELWNNATSVDGYIELDVVDIQIEQKDHVTPYTSGTRTPTIVYDNSGYSNNASITGSLTCSTDTARFNRSTNLVNSYLTTRLYPFEETTISFWINRNTRTGTRQFIYTGWYGISIELTEGNGWQVYYTYNSSGATVLCNPTTSLQANTWYHCAFVIGSTGVKFYINGVVEKTATYQKPYYTANYVDIGNYSTYKNFNAKLSDFRVYSTALSVDDVKELYNTSAYIYNDGTVAAMEFDEGGTNLAIDVEKARITKTGGSGLSSYTQSNCSCTLTDDGYRIYRGPNLTVANNGNTMWGGFVIDNTDNRFNFQKGHTYMIQFEIKGKTSNSVADIYWTNLVGWGGGGLNPNPSDVVIANPITSNYNSSEWKTFSYKWTINDDVYKVCTTAYHTYVQGEIYLSYKGFKYGFGYTSTGELGTDLYIRNIRMYDVTNQTPIDITKTGKIDANNITEETLPAEMTMGGVVGREIIEI